MIDEGLVLNIQQSLVTQGIAATGGFMAELPNDQSVLGWSYLVVSDVSDPTLTTAKTLTMRRVQIDCYANAAADVIRLAKGVKTAIDGFTGNLTDPDSTFVSSCFCQNTTDFFDDARRSYRRMLEFQVLYAE